MGRYDGEDYTDDWYRERELGRAEARIIKLKAENADLRARAEAAEAKIAAVWDEGFRSGRGYEAGYIDWWDNYDHEMPDDEQDPMPYLPGNPHRTVAQVGEESGGDAGTSPTPAEGE